MIHPSVRTAAAASPAQSTGRQRLDGSRPSGNSRNTTAGASRAMKGSSGRCSSATGSAAGSEPGWATSP